jgi:ornithine decarboxylase
MTETRFRGAVSRPRRPTEIALPRSVDALVARLRPEEPLHCLRPAAIAQAARGFLAAFPGTTLYAVKCNPDPSVLGALWRGGVRHFDVASIGEVRLVRSLFPQAALHFMHPVKPRGAIAEAWHRHGVRDFAFDSAAELEKIVALTGEDRGLVLRLALPKGSAAYDLSGKFGAEPAEAVALLRAARPLAARLGVSFHVGSQCLDPGAYARAIALAARVIRLAGVAVEILDVGGGFPAAYPGSEPPPVGAFAAAITAAVRAEGLASLALWAEPGRALVAGGTSVVVQVQARRAEALFINDGVYGALSDAGTPGFRFPARLIRASAAPLSAFRFLGPTCDSADRMEGPFLLPADVAEGEWIEIGQLGAYGAALRTGFNGLDRALLVEVDDAPLAEAGALPAEPAGRAAA